MPSHQLENWRAPWQRDSTYIRSQYQLKAERIINQSRAQAQRDLAQSFARILQSSRSDEALAMRVFQALEASVSDEGVRQFMTRDTAYLLRSFKEWFTEDKSLSSGEEASSAPSLPRSPGTIDPTPTSGDEDALDNEKF